MKLAASGSHTSTLEWEDLRSAFARGAPAFSRLLDKQASDRGPAWQKIFLKHLSAFVADTSDEALAELVRQYARFVIDLQRRQLRFDVTGHYEVGDYNQVFEEIYSNTEFMLTNYYPTLFMAHFLWPHEFENLEFFMRGFLPRLAGRSVRVADVGVGTGLFSGITLSHSSSAVVSGFDVSEASRASVLPYLAGLGCDQRYTHNSRLFTAGEETFDAVVCVEVVEHLEDPLALLCAVKQGLRPGGIAFVTAALNAAHADHIFLYVNREEVVTQLEAAGMRCIAVHEFAAPGEFRAGRRPSVVSAIAVAV